MEKVDFIVREDDYGHRLLSANTVRAIGFVAEIKIDYGEDALQDGYLFVENRNWMDWFIQMRGNDYTFVSDSLLADRRRDGAQV